MTKFYEKHELAFSIICIVIYCMLNTIALNLSDIIKIDSLPNLIFNPIMAVILFVWVRKNGLMEKYGLCKTAVPAKKLLWYIPLAIICTCNLWYGVAINLPLIDSVCFVGSMLCVGFLEELIFRGFIFRAIEKDSPKQAIIISSITFGMGHIINLLNGNGELLGTICQICYAIAIGFMFVTIFCRSGSLVPCIIAHGAFNSLSLFGNDAAITSSKHIIISIILIVLSLGYTFVLVKIHKKEK